MRFLPSGSRKTDRSEVRPIALRGGDDSRIPVGDAMNPALQDTLLQFVRCRIEVIRTGDREALDATYERMCLERQNEYNRHDYQWYLSLIESGFGEATYRIDIQPVESVRPLPFAGLVTYPMPPDFGAFVQTGSGRRTLWLIRYREDTGPKVVLPAFGGRTADSVATGQWRLPTPSEVAPGGVTALTFDPERFSLAVAESVSLLLDSWWHRFKFETLRALVLDCFPWHGQCHIAALTMREGFDEAKYGKWAIADWRWNEVDSINPELLQLLRAYYEGKTVTDAELSCPDRAKVIFRCAAKALQSSQVAESLTRYDLAEDFELAVFNPDDSNERNYCQRSKPE